MGKKKVGTSAEIAMTSVLDNSSPLLKQCSFICSLFLHILELIFIKLYFNNNSNKNIYVKMCWNGKNP